jgi:hypothetical protein
MGSMMAVDVSEADLIACGWSYWRCLRPDDSAGASARSRSTPAVTPAEVQTATSSMIELLTWWMNSPASLTVADAAELLDRIARAPVELLRS